MVKLYHYTAPYAARCNAAQRTYYGGVSFEDGLNVVPATAPWKDSLGYSFVGAEDVGALLELEWTGPVVQGPLAGTAPNTLYDLGIHRLFIPAGTTQHLRLIGMQLHPTLQECAWIGSAPQPIPCALKPSSWAFIFEGSKEREIISWREHDLESARKTLSDVCGQGIPLFVRSQAERPWDK